MITDLFRDEVIWYVNMNIYANLETLQSNQNIWIYLMNKSMKALMK